MDILLNAMDSMENLQYNLHNGAIKAQRMLRKTQHFKYSDIAMYLDRINEDYEFEYVLLGTDCVFDLVLHSRRIFIEFDGTSHDSKQAFWRDIEKEQFAEENGYELVRVKVDDNLVIPADIIAEIVYNYSKVS